MTYNAVIQPILDVVITYNMEQLNVHTTDIEEMMKMMGIVFNNKSKHTYIHVHSHPHTHVYGIYTYIHTFTSPSHINT